MKTDAGLIQHSSRAQFRNAKQGAKTSLKAQSKIEEGSQKPPQDEAQVSKEAKTLNKPEEKSSDSSLLKKVANLPTPPLSELTPPVPKKPLSIAQAKKLGDKGEDHLPVVIKKPAVFFVSGWEMGGLKGPSFLNEMSKYIPDGKHFSWDQKDQMLNEIKRRPLDQPVVLVGYGLGGGTALSMANELNNIKNGFRSINLLVTVDGAMTPNDIVPQNVEKHINFIGDQGGLFHDGPHIARNTEMTEVINELSPEKDVSLEENTELQYKIFQNINEVLCESVIKKDLLNVLSSSEFEPRAILLT